MNLWGVSAPWRGCVGPVKCTFLQERATGSLHATGRPQLGFTSFLALDGMLAFFFITSSLKNVEPFMKSLITILMVSRYCFTGEREGQHLVANRGHTLSNNITHLLSVSGLLCCKKMFGFWFFLWLGGKCMHPKITEIL